MIFAIAVLDFSRESNQSFLVCGYFRCETRGRLLCGVLWYYCLTEVHGHGTFLASVKSETCPRLVGRLAGWLLVATGWELGPVCTPRVGFGVEGDRLFFSTTIEKIVATILDVDLPGDIHTVFKRRKHTCNSN